MVGSRVPYVNLPALFPRTRQQLAVRTVGQRLFLAVASSNPKRVNLLARSALGNAYASIGIRSRDTGPVRAHRDCLRNGSGALELSLMPGGRDVPDVQ